LITEADGQHAFPSVIPQKTPSFSLAFLPQSYFLRSVYIGAVLYTAIRIIEGLIIIALQVRPLGSSRVVSLHRPMLQRRTCRLLEFLAFCFG
jgi:hypothetical protein